MYAREAGRKKSSGETSWEVSPLAILYMAGVRRRYTVLILKGFLCNLLCCFLVLCTLLDLAAEDKISQRGSDEE